MSQKGENMYVTLGGIGLMAATAVGIAIHDYNEIVRLSNSFHFYYGSALLAVVVFVTGMLMVIYDRANVTLYKTRFG